MRNQFLGGTMAVSDIILAAIAEKRIAKGDIAKKMGWSSQSFSNRLKKNTIDADEWVKIAAILGYEVRMIEKTTGELYDVPNKGVGPKVVKMINGVTYDTEKARAIIHTPRIFGCFHELYRLFNDGYFIVTYYDMEGADPAVTPISEEDAKVFIRDCNGASEEVKKVE